MDKFIKSSIESPVPETAISISDPGLGLPLALEPNRTNLLTDRLAAMLM
jgi:hypothetical protein